MNNQCDTRVFVRGRSTAGKQPGEAAGHLGMKAWHWEVQTKKRFNAVMKVQNARIQISTHTHKYACTSFNALLHSRPLRRCQRVMSVAYSFVSSELPAIGMFFFFLFLVAT